MSQGNSRKVSSNQNDIHDKLVSIVKKHLTHSFEKPFEPFNVTAFNQALSSINAAKQKKIIFDSGCGNGKSTIRIAKDHPDAFVIGIDKSKARLDKQYTKDDNNSINNYLLIRSDLDDFLRLAQKEKIKLYKHYFLYPNPWPKKKHLQRRWHGSPLFKTIIDLGGKLEIRSNWKIYCLELCSALELAGYPSTIQQIAFKDNTYLTDFEEKYHLSQQTLWKVDCSLDQPTLK